MCILFVLLLFKNVISLIKGYLHTYSPDGSDTSSFIATSLYSWMRLYQERKVLRRPITSLKYPGLWLICTKGQKVKVKHRTWKRLRLSVCSYHWFSRLNCWSRVISKLSLIMVLVLFIDLICCEIITLLNIIITLIRLLNSLWNMQILFANYLLTLLTIMYGYLPQPGTVFYPACVRLSVWTV